jgi:hypothetical protein
MRKLHIPFLFLVIAIPLINVTPSWAEKNTPNRTSGALSRLVCGALQDKCNAKCDLNLFPGPAMDACKADCIFKHNNCLYPSVVRGGAVKTGKPVQALPSKGSNPTNPTNAAPINSVKPDQPLPRGGGGGKLK